jgi:uncharacterized protein YxjI
MNTAIKNQMDYTLGINKNAIDAQGNVMDYTVGMGKNKMTLTKTLLKLRKTYGIRN